MTNALRNAPAAAVFLLATLTLQAAPVRGEGTVVAGKYNDWTLHINEGKSHKICFITSEPSAKEPSGANRAATLLYVSAWPKDGIKTEVSVKLGYTVKKGSEIKVTADKDIFKMFAKEERGFVEDATQELKLIEAMKKGSTLIVQATSDRGTGTTDTYSLSGFTQALQSLTDNCK